MNIDLKDSEISDNNFSEFQKMFSQSADPNQLTNEMNDILKKFEAVLN